jgi:cytochrome c oxidase cbb3-type subunit 4
MTMDLDINWFRSIVTVAAFAAFLGIVWWAYAPARKPRFERDALLPFDEAEDRAGGER